jgi:hypothetical protein
MNLMIAFRKPNAFRELLKFVQKFVSLGDCVPSDQKAFYVPTQFSPEEHSLLLQQLYLLMNEFDNCQGILPSYTEHL